MGGTDSFEFMCPSPAGEDIVARCRNCGYAANVEKAASALPPIEDLPASDLPSAPERLDTPGVRTIEDLVTGYKLPADRQIKTLVEMLDGKPALVLLRGDHPLSDQKLIDATGAVTVRPAQPEEIRELLGALPGSLGAVGVTDFPVIADFALRGRRGVSPRARTDHAPLTHAPPPHAS